MGEGDGTSNASVYAFLALLVLLSCCCGGLLAGTFVAIFG